MSGERKTEAVVRRHFDEYGGEVVVEEQDSESPKIAKLLKAASKSGAGPGRPDFIVTLENEPDLLVVVECKADVSKHESPERSAYAEYAVDGALHYAAHLSRGFDVLAIAVSGSAARKRVSHFLHFKTQRKAVEAFGENLLAPGEYIRGYRNDPGKFRQDFASLQAFIKDLNNRLHIDKVSESNRSLLISAVLIALERGSFKRGYPAERNPRALARMTVDAAIESLREAGVGGPRIEVIKQGFEFLVASPVLIAKRGELRGIIADIDENVNSFRKTHQYRDVLGSLYIEFLRYANSDKGLGIVLTPPHVTELFADLAGVNAKSVVYDSCAGTGGFLISAMKKMIDDAKGDGKVESRVKTSQLYGVEIQLNIYPLAVSNMFVHQDGKTNIIHGDCFDKNVIARIKELKPNVGMLNPPYKADKKRDVEELDFVLNNLECLSQGGTCVAIAPMQCALSQGGRIADLKRELMSRHTLEAVCSMPDELFFNSKVGVVSCIMVFTAHRPHPGEKNVFLGYFKDDGFEKRKIGGRQDVDGRWTSIERRWLKHYMNRRTAPGLSVNVPLGPRDEWSAELYMETDYSRLTEQMFEDTLHDYSTFLFRSGLRRSVTDDRAGRRREKPLYVGKRWRVFNLEALFDIGGTTTTPVRELEYHRRGEHPYVTTQATDNGVAGFYDRWTEDGGVISVDSAVIGYCSYQAEKFSASDHVETLTPKFPMSARVAMFLVTLLNMERYRYNYGRKRSQTRLRRESLRLPATGAGEPDWAFMERYIEGVRYSANVA